MKTMLTMIVRDEAANLAPCLEGAGGLFDEVVVVDTGSRDDTKEIATRLGARVVDFVWVDDFSAARNAALAHAHGEWVFWLDADDRIDDANRARLGELLGSLRDENLAYLMRVELPAVDGHRGAGSQHVRLFRNDPRIRWEYRVHEQIAAAILRSGGKLRPAGVEIQHVGYSPRANHAKLERNLRLVELDCRAHPKDATCAYHRARLLLKVGRAAEVAAALLPAEAAMRGSRSRRPMSLVRAVLELKARAAVALGRLPQALQAVRAAVVEFPVDLELLFLREEILAAMGSYDAVLGGSCFGAGARLSKDPFATVDSVVALRRRHLRAQVHLLKGEAREAGDLSRAVVQERAAFGPAWITLGHALLAAGDRAAFEALVADLQIQEASGVAATVLRSAEALRDGAIDVGLSLVEAELSSRPYELALLRARVAALFEGYGPNRDGEIAAALARVYLIDPLCPMSRHAERAWQNRRAAGRRAAGS